MEGIWEIAKQLMHLKIRRTSGRYNYHLAHKNRQVLACLFMKGQKMFCFNTYLINFRLTKNCSVASSRRCAYTSCFCR